MKYLLFGNRECYKNAVWFDTGIDLSNPTYPLTPCTFCQVSRDPVFGLLYDVMTYDKVLSTNSDTYVIVNIENVSHDDQINLMTSISQFISQSFVNNNQGYFVDNYLQQIINVFPNVVYFGISDICSSDVFFHTTNNQLDGIIIYSCSGLI
jgi:hypothetical protein